MQPTVVVSAERALDLEFLLKISLELCVDVVDHRLEAILFIHLITVADCIANC